MSIVIQKIQKIHFCSILILHPNCFLKIIHFYVLEFINEFRMLKSVNPVDLFGLFII